MVQRTTTALIPEVEHNTAATVAECHHHWVIQPADGPVSTGACQICGECREFKNYVESATWGDSRIASKNSSASAGIESTSDDQDERDAEEELERVDEENGAEV